MGVDLTKTLACISIMAGLTLSVPTAGFAEEKDDMLGDDVFATSTITENDLENKRGTELTEVELTGAMLDAVSSNNVAIGDSGSNIIGHDAFGNASGIVGVIQNSGDNVVIQSATVVNVKLND